jgi:hypothetical protein
MSKDTAKNGLKFKFVFGDDYNPVFANGVWGGMTAKGELNMNFFHERLPLPHSVVMAVGENGTLGQELERDPGPDDQVVIRYVTTGVVLNYSDAKAIHQWMGEHLKRFEREAGLSHPQENSGDSADG